MYCWLCCVVVFMVRGVLWFRFRRRSFLVFFTARIFTKKRSVEREREESERDGGAVHMRRRADRSGKSKRDEGRRSLLRTSYRF